MNHQSNAHAIRWTTIPLLAAALAVAGCSSGREKADEECVETPEGAAAKAEQNVKVERFGLGKAGAEENEGKDWCRACVMSTLGYASCQRVHADKPDESRDSIRARARAKACADAKYPADKCPDTAVISNQCKGDPPPDGTPDPGKALQTLYKSLGGGQPKPAPAKDDAEPAPAPAKDEAEPQPDPE